MGDSEIPVIDKKTALEMKREESILAKIRDLRKEAGRKRVNMKGNPTRKKMRLSETDCMVMAIPVCQLESVGVEKMGEKKRQLWCEG